MWVQVMLVRAVIYEIRHHCVQAAWRPGSSYRLSSDQEPPVIILFYETRGTGWGQGVQGARRYRGPGGAPHCQEARLISIIIYTESNMTLLLGSRSLR